MLMWSVVHFPCTLMSTTASSRSCPSQASNGVSSSRRLLRGGGRESNGCGACDGEKIRIPLRVHIDGAVRAVSRGLLVGVFSWVKPLRCGGGGGCVCNTVVVHCTPFLAAHLRKGSLV